MGINFIGSLPRRKGSGSLPLLLLIILLSGPKLSPWWKSLKLIPSNLSKRTSFTSSLLFSTLWALIIASNLTMWRSQGSAKSLESINTSPLHTTYKPTIMLRLSTKSSSIPLNTSLTPLRVGYGVLPCIVGYKAMVEVSWENSIFNSLPNKCYEPRGSGSSISSLPRLLPTSLGSPMMKWGEQS